MRSITFEVMPPNRPDHAMVVLASLDRGDGSGPLRHAAEAQDEQAGILRNLEYFVALFQNKLSIHYQELGSDVVKQKEFKL